MESIKPHSKLGVVSGGIGIAMFLIFLLGVLFYNLETTDGYSIGQGEFASDIRLLNLVLLMLAPVPVHSSGLILGLVSLFFPNRRKLFPIVGIFLNLIFGVLSLFPWLYLTFYSLGRVQ